MIDGAMLAWIFTAPVCPIGQQTRSERQRQIVPSRIGTSQNFNPALQADMVVVVLVVIIGFMIVVMIIE